MVISGSFAFGAPYGWLRFNVVNVTAIHGYFRHAGTGRGLCHRHLLALGGMQDQSVAYGLLTVARSLPHVQR